MWTHGKETMMNLIDRDHLLEQFGEEPEVWNNEDWEIAERNMWNECRDLVLAEDVVDTTKRSIHKAIWVKYVLPVSDDDGQDAYDCSFCGAMVNKPTRYCPSCGARMYRVI